jgi:transcriptional regulator with XRE-family HTH domain
MPQTTRAPRSVARSQLGARLRELRERAELTLAEAAACAESDAGALSRVENGLRGLPLETAERLLDCYGVRDTAVRNEVQELIRVDGARRRRPAWWKRHHEVLSPTHFDGYLALEANACALRNYEPLLVPGLLQTAEYAHVAIASMRPELGQAQVKQLVEIRMARQHKVLEGDTIELSALVDEAVLLRLAEHRPIVRGQLERLVEASDRPQTTIRLAPMSLGLHPGAAGAFMLMSFPETTRDVVWVETMHRAVYFEEEAEVEHYTEAFAKLWDRALTPDDTRARLKEMIKELPE